MNFHEYQSKQLLAEYGIPVPAGKVAATPDEAVEVANSLGKGPWMVKAQIHAGGRGKAGGVKFCKTTDDVKAAAAKMLGTKMSTYQTAGVELPINLVLVTTAGEIVKELYLSILVDRGTKTITYIASSEGGVEIEQVAAQTPELIHSLNVDFVEGVQGYHGRDFGFKLGLTAKQAGQFASIMVNLYRLFNEKDLALVEINPLAILDDGNLYALDGKFDSDDNAAFRQKQLIAMRDKTQEDETEVTASELDINYVTMDGNIGCMVNGAGLAMATMDVIKLNGGEPANFLDVGGGANKQRVIEAFKLILSSDKVEGIFVNIFGGIVRCDMIAEGIIAAVKEVGVKVPVVVRLEGTNVEEGKQLLRDSGMAIIPADNINDGAKKVVEAVKNAA
ncbi:succinyl-CoA synthetase beta subunit [Xanthomonas campestris]|uniref:ADP-forming succinate--CoA ligase subunit beta n=1 Tax=Xanthomonas TaxID=338 RepID=UPI000CEE36D0|nr:MULTISPECIES: ADP-forming succinate--CoA ligase subunit beta [Xanthomonas]MBB5734915.1 succinyl-CoA synthetase beta subunit [Xanthomonas sp. CFBP 8152]NIJ75630.1 succinyl-CoA synthetase beta subunit [Xanthomonas sp. CFBP 8151]PPT74338.1 succinate--CoA ligase subunit beta [Xanthomonas arboricola]